MNASENPSEGRVAYVLARVNSGLATEWSQIAQLASSLERMLKDARALGERHIRADRRSEWNAAWQEVQTIFDQIRSLDAEAQQRFTADEPSSDPLEPWSDVWDMLKAFMMVPPKPPEERVRDKYPIRLQRPPLQRE